MVESTLGAWIYLSSKQRRHVIAHIRCSFINYFHAYLPDDALVTNLALHMTRTTIAWWFYSILEQYWFMEYQSIILIYYVNIRTHLRNFTTTGAHIHNQGTLSHFFLSWSWSVSVSVSFIVIPPSIRTIEVSEYKIQLCGRGLDSPRLSSAYSSE